jgi:hypothetical protein
MTLRVKELTEENILTKKRPTNRITHMDEPYTLYSLPHIAVVIESKWMRQIRKVGDIGKTGVGPYKI